MKHYGDITKIDGHKVEIPHIITGGSPCQDLSVAGKREGLKGERSGLFMEQIRLTKELREQDVRTNQHLGMAINPRFFVWENVVGSMSSGKPKGEDFRIVLEEICKVADENANVPRCKKWNNAGCIMGDGYSVAWRVHNASEWGVPQRRRRICVLADFNGQTAPKILFELRRETVSEDGEQTVGYTGNERSPKVLPFGKSVSGDSESIGEQREKVADAVGDCVEKSDKSFCITTSHGGFMVNADDSGIAHTLQATDYKDPQLVAYGFDRAAYNQGKNAKFNFSVEKEKIATQTAKGPGEVCIVGDVESITFLERAGKPGGGKGILVQKELCSSMVCGSNIYTTSYGADNFYSVVRRLTPLECERLQGFPDNFTNIGDWVDSTGKMHKGDSDAPRYKALGNSIALPFWEWLGERIIKQLKEDGVENTTMASLFDGIGGFPLVFQRHGCKPIWASEIEEFPMAVTKIRFPED